LGEVGNVWAIVRAPGYAPKPIRLERPTADVGELRIELSPVRQVRVQVREAGTNQPIAHAAITVLMRRLAFHAHFTTWEHGIRTVHEMEPSEWDYRCDAQGELLLEVPQDESVELLVTPPSDQPWLGIRKVLSRRWTGDTFTLSLPRGQWLCGCVQEIKTDGTPPAAVPHAVVHWAQLDATKPEWTGPVLSGRDALVSCDEQGRFRVAVPPGEVILRAYGFTPDYVPVVSPTPANKRTLFAHAVERVVIRSDPKMLPSVRLTLQRGLSTRGVALLPNGSPVRSAMLLCADRVSPVRGYSMQPLPVTDGVYTLPGGRPDKLETVYLLEPHARLGAVVKLPCGAPGPTVHLSPCGSAQVRILCADGQPAVGAKVSLDLLAEFDAMQLDQPASWFDPINHSQFRVTDAEGWVEVPALIPEANYQLRVQLGTLKQKSPVFQVKSATKERLPDIHLPKESAVFPKEKS
ncbi:MAG: hypothetical protein SNJ82_07465, partial [Gemmataceae bacterium]